MDLNDCFRKGLIKKTQPNEELVKSLIEMSKIKEMTVNTAGLNEMNISAYVPVAYDSLREILEAVCISKGYKVLSHVCIGELLRSMDKGFEFEEFDRFRYIRNGINYYGVKVEFSQGRDIIRKLFSLKNRIMKAYLPAFSRQ